ncbi:BQ00720 family protein [Lichenifustis flavocetrariae]|uniref:DUF1150 domain-containing protein n=1 Tax=Lichenifustis flavocetrariae TaxID=2949735 RepID=A0AA41YYT5_9HYPH|nr:DUF1150 domain-containing protein [Lichenifustis flavocetrariae]MCW6507373.1 DUF1150 domain-containing protein [Lichenifustis flavocetrariae]
MNIQDTHQAPLSPDDFAHLGQGAIAYVKAIKSDDVSRLFPQVSNIQPGLDLFLLLGADGVPIMLTDSKDAAVANAWEHQLQTVSLH